MNCAPIIATCIILVLECTTRVETGATYQCYECAHAEKNNGEEIDFVFDLDCKTGASSVPTTTCTTPCAQLYEVANVENPDDADNDDEILLVARGCGDEDTSNAGDGFCMDEVVSNTIIYSAFNLDYKFRSLKDGITCTCSDDLCNGENMQAIKQTADDSPKCFSCFDLSLENGNKEVDEAIIEDLETKKLINRGCKDHIDVDEPELSCPYGCMYGAAAGKVVVEGGYTTDFVFYERRCARDGLSSGSCISEPVGVQEVVQATVDDLGIRGRVTSGRLCHCDNALCNDNVIPTIESTGSTPSRPAMITCAALLILKLL